MSANCPKCCSTYFVMRWGISQYDRRGEAYRYGSCLLCGFVQHVRNADEERDYTHERINNLGETLHTATRKERLLALDLVCPLGPKDSK